MLIFHSRTLIPLWSTLASIRYSITHRQSTRLLFHPSILFRTTSYVKSISFYRSLRTSTWLDLFRIEVFCIFLLQERAYAYIYVYPLYSYYLLFEPKPGLEPGTYSLRMNCSTNWAISAIYDYDFIKSNNRSSYRGTKIELYSISGNSFR